MLTCRPFGDDGGEVVTIGSTDWVFGLAGDPLVGQVTRNVIDHGLTTLMASSAAAARRRLVAIVASLRFDHRATTPATRSSSSWKTAGSTEPTAECVVDAFFEGKTNEELKGFFDRPQLTPEEAAEFAALGQKCAAQS